MAGGCAQVAVALALLQVPPGLALDLDNSDQDCFFSCSHIQGGTFGGVEVELYPPSYLRADVQHPLDLVGLPGKED